MPVSRSRIADLCQVMAKQKLGVLGSKNFRPVPALSLRFSCSWNPGFDPAFTSFAPWFDGSLIGVVLVSIAVFFLPLLTIHRLMKEEAACHETRVLALAGRIADLEELLLSSGSWPNYEELEARLAQIESLRNTYLHQRQIPTWPVNFETRGIFLSAQVALRVGIPTSVLNLWEKVTLSIGSRIRIKK